MFPDFAPLRTSMPGQRRHRFSIYEAERHYALADVWLQWMETVGGARFRRGFIVPLMVSYRAKFINYISGLTTSEVIFNLRPNQVLYEKFKKISTTVKKRSTAFLQTHQNNETGKDSTIFGSHRPVWFFGNYYYYYYKILNFQENFKKNIGFRGERGL